MALYAAAERAVNIFPLKAFVSSLVEIEASSHLEDFSELDSVCGIGKFEYGSYQLLLLVS